MQDYRNLIKKTGGFDEGIRLGLGYQEAMIANANNRAIVQKNQRLEAQEVQKQQYMQKLSDQFNDPQFQGMTPRDQMKAMRPNIAQVNPDMAVKGVQDQIDAEQAAALQAQKDQQANLQAKTKNDMDFLQKTLDVFVKAKDNNGLKSFLNNLKATGEYPILNNVDSIDLDADEGGYSTTIITDMPEKNKLGVPSGRYKITSETKPDGTQAIKKIESEEESLTLQDGTVNGQPVKAWVSKSGKIKGQNGEDLSGRFKPAMTTKERNVITFGMPTKEEKPGEDQKTFLRKIGDLNGLVTKDPNLKRLKEAKEGNQRILQLLNLPKNATAIQSAIFAIAKQADSGKLSDQDVDRFSNGASASAWAKLLRIANKQTTGETLLPSDIKALKEVAQLNTQYATSGYNREWSNVRDNLLISADNLAPNKKDYINSFFNRKTQGSAPQNTDQPSVVTSGKRIIKFDKNGKRIN